MAACAAQEYTLSPPSSKGRKGPYPISNPKKYYLAWAAKWWALAEAIRDGGWLPTFEALSSYLKSEPGKTSGLAECGRAVMLLDGALELRQLEGTLDRKQFNKTSIDALARALAAQHGKDPLHKTLGGELSVVIQAMTQTAHRTREMTQEEYDTQVYGLLLDGGGPIEVAEDDNSTDDAEATAPVVRFDRWAFGFEKGNTWHAFRAVKKGGKPIWRHHGPLKGIRKGLQNRLMTELAERGGLLSFDEIVKKELPGPLKVGSTDRQNLKDKIEPEFSKIRKAMMEKMRVARVSASGKTRDPLPYDPGSASWKASVQIGYAILRENDATGKQELCFQLRAGLDPEDQFDRDVN